MLSGIQGLYACDTSRTTPPPSCETQNDSRDKLTSSWELLTYMESIHSIGSLSFNHQRPQKPSLETAGIGKQGGSTHSCQNIYMECSAELGLCWGIWIKVFAGGWKAEGNTCITKEAQCAMAWNNTNCTKELNVKDFDMLKGLYPGNNELWIQMLLHLALLMLL